LIKRMLWLRPLNRLPPPGGGFQDLPVNHTPGRCYQKSLRGGETRRPPGKGRGRCAVRAGKPGTVAWTKRPDIRCKEFTTMPPKAAVHQGRGQVALIHSFAPWRTAVFGGLRFKFLFPVVSLIRRFSVMKVVAVIARNAAPK
jgi:hypothetical protein